MWRFFPLRWHSQYAKNTLAMPASVAWAAGLVTSTVRSQLRPSRYKVPAWKAAPWRL